MPGRTVGPTLQLRRSDPGGGDSQQLARTNGLSTFGWMPDGGLLVSQVERADPYTAYGDLYIMDLEGRSERLTEGARLSQPSVASDGAWAVAVQQSEGTNGLVRVDLVTGDVSTLVAPVPDVHWAFPELSPNGRWIAASRWESGAYHDVVILDATGRGRIAGADPGPCDRPRSDMEPRRAVARLVLRPDGHLERAGSRGRPDDRADRPPSAAHQRPDGRHLPLGRPRPATGCTSAAITRTGGTPSAYRSRPRPHRPLHPLRPASIRRRRRGRFRVSPAVPWKDTRHSRPYSRGTGSPSIATPSWRLQCLGEGWTCDVESCWASGWERRRDPSTS